ncbi:MAG: CoA ester lyase [Burkholderiales bacterium]|nr:CoA ester lyase [Burkholderiales bacterium]
MRSFLFVPANHARRVEKALGSEADAVILDLEDAVAVSEKPAARAAAAEALARPRRGRLFVRVNGVATEWCLGDLTAVLRPGLDGIVLPKAESAADLRAIDWLMTGLERERGLARGAVELMPIVETATGFLRLDRILAARSLKDYPGAWRVRRITFGAADLARDLGMTWTAGEEELAPYRAQLVLASRAAGLEPPVDTVWVRLKDIDGLRRSAETSLRSGFHGKLCIHPDQVAVVNAVFTPEAEEVERARRIVAAFEKAEREGSAAIEVGGTFVDYPVVERARRTLALAAALAARGA